MSAKARCILASSLERLRHFQKATDTPPILGNGGTIELRLDGAVSSYVTFGFHPLSFATTLI
jgi:hypothetical protein